MNDSFLCRHWWYGISSSFLSLSLSLSLSLYCLSYMMIFYKISCVMWVHIIYLAINRISRKKRSVECKFSVCRILFSGVSYFHIKASYCRYSLVNTFHCILVMNSMKLNFMFYFLEIYVHFRLLKPVWAIKKQVLCTLKWLISLLVVSQLW